MDEGVEKYLKENIPLLSEQIKTRIEACVLGESVKCEEEDIAIGESKFCGKPDVPEGFTWPMTKDGPCWFIGQLNLEKLNSFEFSENLPKEGLLSFFYHDEGGPAGKESKVFYFPKGPFRRIDIVPDTRWREDFHDTHFYPRTLELTQGYSLPDFEYLELSDEESLLYEDLEDVIDEFNDEFCDGTHQFLGFPRYLWEGAPRDIMLASFGELEDRIRYFIDPRDLKESDFSNIEVIYNCT